MERAKTAIKRSRYPPNGVKDSHFRPSPGVVLGVDRWLDSLLVGNRAASSHPGEVAPAGRLA